MLEKEYRYMLYDAALLAIYLSIWCWYCVTGASYHRKNKHNKALPIEKWISAMLALGVAEMLFRTGSYFVWRRDGDWEGLSVNWALYVSIAVGVFKKGLSRGLLLMLCRGWGVTKPTWTSLGRRTLFLGGLLTAAYIAAALTNEVLVARFLWSSTDLTDRQEARVENVIVALGSIILVLNTIFAGWILCGLWYTVRVLRKQNYRDGALRRYVYMRRIFVLATVVQAVCASLAAAGAAVYHQEDRASDLLYFVGNVNYIFILTGMAVLWGPSANTKESDSASSSSSSSWLLLQQQPNHHQPLDNDQDDGRGGSTTNIMDIVGKDHDDAHDEDDDDGDNDERDEYRFGGAEEGGSLDYNNRSNGNNNNNDNNSNNQDLLFQIEDAEPS